MENRICNTCKGEGGKHMDLCPKNSVVVKLPENYGWPSYEKGVKAERARLRAAVEGMITYSPTNAAFFRNEALSDVLRLLSDEEVGKGEE